MKDSVGSTVLMKIFVVFMVVYIILMASILNYTKTFRIKNQVVNIINRNGGYTTSAESEITDYISKSSIYGKCNLLEGNNEFGSNKEDKCEIKEYQMTDAAGGSYYKVRVYVTFQFPLIKQTLQIPITGETKRLYGAPSTPGNGPKYDIVNRSYNPNDEKVDLGIENETCMPGSAPSAATGCCSNTICSSGTRRYVDGVCGCYNEKTGVKVGDTSCNVNQKGRIMSNNRCSCCPSNCSNTISASVSGQGSSSLRADLVRLIIRIAGDNDIGVKGEVCKIGGKRVSTNGGVFIYTLSGGCIDTVDLSCESFNNSVSQTINVYTRAPYCAKCTTNGTCDKCEDGYYAGDGRCNKCLDICETCSGGSSCDTCIAGYVKSGISCRPCSEFISNCSECSSTTVCTKCSGDYVVENNKCVLNQGSCFQCCNSQGCIFNWNESGTAGGGCSRVDKPKSECSGSTRCSNISDCTACTQNKSGYCTSCNAGYKVKNGNCSKISCSNISGCSRCKSNKTGDCLECDSGKYLSGGKCYSCSTGCNSCTSSTNCTKCQSGYYQNGSSCYQCPTGCSSCTSTSCITCDSDHVKAQDNKTCCTKKSNCSTYLANCNCKDCANGYETDGKGGCKKKSAGATCTNIAGCIQYAKDCTCSVCNSAYEKKNGKCELKDDSINCTYPKYLCPNGLSCCQDCSNASKPNCLAGKCTSCNTETGKWKACAPGNCLAQ